MSYDSGADTLYVCSGWGSGSDWFRKIENAPAAEIHVRSGRSASSARHVDTTEAARVLVDYATHNPGAWGKLSKAMIGEAPSLFCAVLRCSALVWAAGLCYHPTVPKTRVDVLLEQRGLAPTLAKAQALILAGVVYSGERRVDKAGEQLADDSDLSVRGEEHPFVSRGGVKLSGALDAFHFDPAGHVAADFGASTGGFTDCLLQRGAVRVYAIDVGYGQLHHTLRADPRVVVMERTNARHLKADALPEPVSLVVIDASFIGLEKLLPAAHALLSPGGEVLAMVKPQFQVARDQLGQGGVVRDPALRTASIEFVAAAARALGFAELGCVDAPIKGPKGNHEAFLWLRKAEA